MCSSSIVHFQGPIAYDFETRVAVTGVRVVPGLQSLGHEAIPVLLPAEDDTGRCDSDEHAGR
jgi:hypothetical protein